MSLSVPAPQSRWMPFRSLSHPREVVRRFTPNWFATTMGTGILAIALAQFPDVPGLATLGHYLWLANCLLFAVCALLYAAHWLLYPHEARRIFAHATLSMFLGCIPMGLATIVNGILIFAVPTFGAGAVALADGLWRVDVGLALACGLAVPFLMFTRQSHAIEDMTGVWLLPVVASGVAAVSGLLLMPHLADSAGQMTVLAVCLALWAMSVPLALGILVILFLRMAVHKLPQAGMAASSFLALGPIGTGAFGLMIVSQNAPAVLAANGLGGIAGAFAGAGLLGAILLWGYGLWWMAAAILITLRHLREGLPFNLGWWGYIFPLGVYAVATLRLATILPLPALAAFGAALVAALALLWIVVGTRTIRGAWRGTLFASPCLRSAWPATAVLG